MIEHHLQPFQIKMNAAIKRPPEPDPSYGTGKRVKTPLQQLSPQHALIQNSAIIADIKVIFRTSPNQQIFIRRLKVQEI
ncbi:unnamed protein product [Callosobruchus maculatus]|uniref:Uncharacterized protein n=1 Tax=Callosobruchus maculatus TaxID=64391 RepID=A0A653BKI3_CALMS|nr:unnamed protein product [Callosobruchus maculatus]